MINKLKVYKVLSSKDRISSVDIFRGIAITSVVLFHYNNLLPYGELGVDLFFVISGLLVGGILTKQFEEGRQINFFRFILQRGFKIWPSYYAFLIAGTLIAYFLYRNSDPSQIISLAHAPRYLFFYENYFKLGTHWSFDHVWSLCVEEHFYILLPIIFIFIQRMLPAGSKKTFIFLAMIGLILLGEVAKPLSRIYMYNRDSFAGTQNRLDALAWGVLLNLLLVYYGDRLKKWKLRPWLTVIGIILFAITLYVDAHAKTIVFNRMLFHSIVPICFFLMILGAYYIDFSSWAWKPLRFIAYYSYNWYLWHVIFIIAINNYFKGNFPGFLVYIFASFGMAFLFTLLIEEPFLAMRKNVLIKLFGKERSRKFSSS